MCKLDIYLYLPKNITTSALFRSVIIYVTATQPATSGIYYEVPIFVYICCISREKSNYKSNY